MRWDMVIIGLGLIACGGNEDGGPDGTNGTEAEVPFDRDLCDEIPFYEVDGYACETIVAAMDLTMEAARACVVDSDCQLITGDCNANPVTQRCWYPVNQCDSPIPPWPDSAPGQGWAAFDRFLSAYNGAGCVYPSGGCGACPPPPEVACIDEECTCVGEGAETCADL